MISKSPGYRLLRLKPFLTFRGICVTSNRHLVQYFIHFTKHSRNSYYLSFQQTQQYLVQHLCCKIPQILQWLLVSLCSPQAFAPSPMIHFNTVNVDLGMAPLPPPPGQKPPLRPRDILKEYPLESQKTVPLTCHGHSRPVTHLSYSSVLEGDTYYLVSACKGMIHSQLNLCSAHKYTDNYPMLRDGITGDW